MSAAHTKHANDFDLCSLCPGFGNRRVWVGKELRQFFESPTFFPPCDSKNSLILRNVVLLFRCSYWFLDVQGDKKHWKVIAHALGNPRLYAGLRSIERDFLGHRADYLDGNEGPAYPEGLSDDQELLLELVDGLSDVEDVAPSLGAQYRHADCRERWHFFLKHLKDTGDLRAWDTDPDTAFEDKDTDTAVADTDDDMDITNTPMDTDSEGGDSTIQDSDASDDHDTASLIPYNADVVRLADGLAEHLPSILQHYADFEATGYVLPSIFTRLRDAVRDDHEFLQRYTTAAQTELRVEEEGSDSDDSLFVTQ
ncbi:hypothetical protein QBC41DRAFT_386016 [Cercophora samala]|uniref:Uncharacterized protein n=1 Tax=Cercophora samala TaxID=330535 RepID=A0AA39ZI60_9PEZI|nr:hypothetical protein QBC41DRAFT_386016 [Cercophora samala]